MSQNKTYNKAFNKVKFSAPIIDRAKIRAFPKLPPAPLFNSISVSRGGFLNRKNVTEEEILCCLMGKIGFSAKCISRKTKLPIKEVWKTLKKAQIKLYDFRNGESQWGKVISNKCADTLKHQKFLK